MKIFGSISELVDLAFRLAGGKQVKIRSASQNAAANATTIISIPDVAPGGNNTGDQNMVLEKVPQVLLAKTLTSPVVNTPTVVGGSIDNTPIGQTQVAAGSFSTLSATSSATLPGVDLTVAGFTTGVLHSNNTGDISSSEIVNADISPTAAIAFDKLASLPSGSILIGSGSNKATTASVKAGSDISLSYSATEVDIQLVAGTIVNADVNANADIAASKIKAGTVKRPIVSDATTGILKSNPSSLNHQDILYWDDTAGDFKSVSGISSTEAGYLEGLTGSIKDSLDSKAALNPLSAQLLKNTNLEDTTVQIVDASDNTKAIKFNAAGTTGTATTLTSSQTTNKTITLPDVAGTLITSGDSGTVTNSMLAGSIDLTTKVTGALPIANGGTNATTASAARTNLGLGTIATQDSINVAITGGTVDSTTSNRLRSAMDSAAITLGALPATKGFMRITTGESTLNTINDPSGTLALSGVNLVLNNFSVASDVTITNAGNIVTGTGADFTLKQGASVSLVHNGNSKFVLTGGAGSGGLATAYLTASTSGIAATHYLSNLSSQGVVLTLPSGVDGAVIRASDAGEKWNVYPLTITPAAGQKIDNLALNESLVCDVKGGWVELSYNSTFGGWALMSLGSVSGSNGSAGEKNYISSPNNNYGSAWVSSNAAEITVSTETTAVNLPDNVSQATGLKFLRISGASYVYFRFTLDKADYSKKLKLQFDQAYAGTAGQYTVSVFSNTASNYGGTSTQLSVQSSSIPALTGTFTTSFDAPGSTAPYLEVRVNGIGGVTPLYVNNFLVGPGTITQGAVISEWQSYTPTATNLTVGNGILTGLFRRVGTNAEIRIDFNSGTTSSYTTTDWKFSLPTGLTWLIPSNVPNHTALGTATGQFNDAADGESRNGIVVGQGLVPDATSVYVKDAVTKTSYTGLFWNKTTTGVIDSLANSRMSLNFTVPIAEWAGSGGTVNLGAGAQQEFAFNSTAWGTNNTTAFAYGSGGASITGVLGAQLVQRVRFQYPIQADDILSLEFSTDGTFWRNSSQFMDAAGNPIINSFSSTASVSNSAGAYLQTVTSNTTDVDVYFFRYASLANDDLPAVDWVNGWKWRVRKSKASSPVGFGVASVANGFGLVAPRKGQQALTVTSSQAGWATTRAVGIYYQDQDGNHRLKFNIVGTHTSATVTAITLTITGVTFKNVSGFDQACSALLRGVTTITPRASAVANTSTVEFASTSAAGCTGAAASGDVELETKPTWA